MKKIYLLIIILVLVACGAGFVYFKIGHMPKIASLEVKNVDTTNWATYENKDFGVSFKYPSNLSGPEVVSPLGQILLNVGFSTNSTSAESERIVFLVTTPSQASDVQKDAQDFFAGKMLTLRPDWCRDRGQLSYLTVSNEKALVINCDGNGVMEIIPSTNLEVYHNGVNYSLNVSDSNSSGRQQIMDGIINTFSFTK